MTEPSATPAAPAVVTHRMIQEAARALRLKDGAITRIDATALASVALHAAFAARGTDPALVEGYCTCLDKPMRDCGISAHRRAAGAPNFQVSAPKVGTGQAGSKSGSDAISESTDDEAPKWVDILGMDPEFAYRTNLVGELRKAGDPDCDAAADEIERLNAALAAVRADWGGIPDEAVDRAAEVRAECICKYDGQADVRWEPGCPVHNVLLGELAAVRAELAATKAEALHYADLAGRLEHDYDLANRGAAPAAEDLKPSWDDPRGPGPSHLINEWFPHVLAARSDAEQVWAERDVLLALLALLRREDSLAPAPDDDALISEARRSADDHEREGWTKAPPLLRRLADRLAGVCAERDHLWHRWNDEYLHRVALAKRLAAVRAAMRDGQVSWSYMNKDDPMNPGPMMTTRDALLDALGITLFQLFAEGSALGSSTGTEEAL